MGTPVFRVMLTMSIKPGAQQDFERAWDSVGASVTSWDGNLGQALMHSAEDTTTYFIVSDWVDEETFRDFEHSDRHLEHRRHLHPYRDGGTMHTMTVLRQLAPATVPA